MGNILSISLSCDAIVTCCWNPLTERASYVCRLEENLQALDSRLRELTALKIDVKKRVEVEVAKQPELVKPLERVQTWISIVEKVEAQDNKVVNDGAGEIEKLCCGGCCSKRYISSYMFGEKVAKMLVELSDLKREGDFKEVVAESPSAALVNVNERPVEQAVGMESMFEKVWRHIEDNEVGIIGLYGMGGVGKTTLLTKVNNYFKHIRSEFNLVIWVVVSKNLKLEKIQDDIAKEVGILDDTWRTKAHDEKADLIYRVLCKKRFVLLLDDIWKRVELVKVGVPVPDGRNKYKIVFTTRSEEVCGNMGAHKKIKVECLAWDKAWNLFQEIIGKGTLSIHPNIPQLAEMVAKECGGLPLALNTVGRAMACKTTPQEWKHALQVLKKSAADFSGMGDEVFPLLKFSYDNLRSDEDRSCFLYCALFPEDFLIRKDDLSYCWMGDELLNQYANVDEAQNKGYDIIGTLIRACLLEDHQSCVKMHDVIRDMALWLASDPQKTDERFLVLTGAESVDPSLLLEKWKCPKRVSLMRAEFGGKLAILPDSPNLLTLLLGQTNLTYLPNDGFNSMIVLRVLDLSENSSLSILPKSISNLVTLKHLNLSSTAVEELPEELIALVQLEYLNLENMIHLKIVPPKLISSFSKLKVLRMLQCGKSDQILFDGENAMIEELQGLKHLDHLTLSIRSTSCFRKFFGYDRLVTCTRILWLTDIDNKSNCLDISSLVDMKHLDSLEIHSFPNLEQLDFDRAGRAANDPHSTVTYQSCSLSLQNVTISRCDQLKDLTWLIFAPNLMRLDVSSCPGMKKIIDFNRVREVANVVKEVNPFEILTILNLKSLPVLESIYENALPFPYLKKIGIDVCPKLKKLPLNSSSAPGRSNLIINGDQQWWNGLVWEDQLSSDVFLSCFRVQTSAQ